MHAFMKGNVRVCKRLHWQGDTLQECSSNTHTRVITRRTRPFESGKFESVIRRQLVGRFQVKGQSVNRAGKAWHYMAAPTIFHLPAMKNALQ